MKWARDYRSDGFSVWTSDELNVNSLHGRGRDVGRGLGQAGIERSERSTNKALIDFRQRAGA